MRQLTAWLEARREILPAFFAMMMGALAVWLGMEALAPALEGNRYLYDFNVMLEGCKAGNLFYRLMWLLADLTEGSFLASMPAALGMAALGFAAAALERKGSPLAGTGVDGNGQVFSVMFWCASASMALGQILYGDWFAGGFVPTFASFLTVQVFLLFFGTRWKKAVTITLVCAGLTCPVCYWFQQNIVTPLGLPTFVCVSAGLLVVVPACTLLFSQLPWMTERERRPKRREPKGKLSPSAFFVHRVLGDVGAMVVWGSSLATIGMYAGAALSWVLNPTHPAYATGRLPLLLAVQVCTGALSVLFWYPKWKEEGGAFTFAGMVFASAIAVTYEARWQILVPTVLMGAAVFEPMVSGLLKAVRYRERIPAIFYIQLCIGLTCTAWSFVVMKVLEPLL